MPGVVVSGRVRREGGGPPRHQVSHMTVHGLLSDTGYRMHATVKREELVGDTPGYENGGRQRGPKGKPEKAGTHDFPDPNRPKAIPYGVYDIGVHTGTGWGKSSWLVSQPTPGLIFMCVTTRLPRLPDRRHARMVIALGVTGALDPALERD